MTMPFKKPNVVAHLSGPLPLFSYVFLVLYVCSALQAATYYLDPASGADSNLGTQVDLAWKTMDRAASGSVPGDSIFISNMDQTVTGSDWPDRVYYTQQISQFGITWSFDRSYLVGQFANHDVWVLGPVRIVAIAPPSTSQDGRVKHGSMFNPSPLVQTQGYDSAMAYNTYDAGLNRALGVSQSQPLDLGEGSLISTISVDAAGNRPQLKSAAILTVLAQPAASGSFRPAYSAPVKSIRYNRTRLDYSMLARLTPTAGTPPLESVERFFERPWIDHKPQWTGRFQHPVDNMPDYGREMADRIGIGALMLHLDYSNAEKATLLTRYVQLGIDLYGIIEAGGIKNWMNDGGHAGGRKWPILFAGLILDDPAMKAIGSRSGDYLFADGYGPGNPPPGYVHFGEDDQTFYVSQIDVDATNSNAWAPDNRDTLKIPYTTADLGLPEWGIRHATIPQVSNKWLPTMYRGVAGPPLHGFVLAALVMNAKSLWNHDALFDYTDRYMAFTAPGGAYEGWWRSLSPFTENMWDTYRVLYGNLWSSTGAGGDQPGGGDSTPPSGTGQGTNQPPFLTSIPDIVIEVNSLVNFTVHAIDPDGDFLSYAAQNLPSGANFTVLDQIFTWTPSKGQEGSHQIPFIASDGTDESMMTVTILVDPIALPPDVAPPTVENCNPQDQTIQAPLNTLISFTLIDTGLGVDANSVVVQLNDEVVYSGNKNEQETPWGHCRRTAVSNGYHFSLQSNQLYGFDRPVNLIVNAVDLAGNTMSPFLCKFTTEMRSYGDNTSVSPPGSLLNGEYPKTLSDSLGTIWVTWHAGNPGARDIYIASLNPQTNQFSEAHAITSHSADQCFPSLAIDAEDRLWIAWQDNARGDWDIHIAQSNDGLIWIGPVRVTDSNDSQTHPALAVGGPSSETLSLAYQGDDRGNLDIYVSTSTNGYATSSLKQVTTEGHDQFEPTIAVADNGNTYVVWTDGRMGSNDLYGASSRDGDWTNHPLVIGPANQRTPAIAFEGVGESFHLAWADTSPGNWDIFYARSVALKDGPFLGMSVVDDTTGADQVHPALALTVDDGSVEVFACWTDYRSVRTSQDSDIYFVDLSTGSVRTNVLVGDDGTNSNQSESALAIGQQGHPYLVWTDDRDAELGIYCAGNTFLDPVPFRSALITPTLGGIVGTPPDAITSEHDVSVVLPPGTVQSEVTITISKMRNRPNFDAPCLGAWDFGPSGIKFNEAVTLTIPYSVSATLGSAQPYWYNSLTAALSENGITDIRDITLSPTLHALSFKTTHFTPFYILGSFGTSAETAADSGGGGCCLSSSHDGSLAEFLLPFIGLVVWLGILRRGEAKGEGRRVIGRTR